MQFLFSIGYQPSCDGFYFLQPSWEDICPKLISVKFEALQTCYQLSCISKNFPVLIFHDSEQNLFFQLRVISLSFCQILEVMYSSLFFICVPA